MLTFLSFEISAKVEFGWRRNREYGILQPKEEEMSKANLLLSALLLATWCFGQTDSGASDVSKNTNVTIQGCLSGSPDAYVLTDEAKTQYPLTGNTDGLEPLVGQD